MHYDAQSADRVKLIFWDGTGVVLVAKRLEEGQFRWPKVQDGVMRLTAADRSRTLRLARRARLAPRSRAAPDHCTSRAKLTKNVVQFSKTMASACNA
jgi:transposase